MIKPLISIVTPFKNTEAYISECLLSIINQTYQNWELLIVDDASTDTSYSIVSQFAETDNRIKLLKNPGTGIIEALQYGYSKSSGKYITRMDSDDIMTPNRLAVMIENLQHFGLGYLAIGQVEYFRADGLSDGYANYETWLNGLTATGSNFTEIYKECVVPSPCWMLHKTDFDNCQAFSPEIYPEDYDLAFRFYKQKLICIPCNNVLHLWRDYSNRTSRTHVHYAQNSFLELKVDYFIELDYKKHRPLVVWGAGKKGKTVAKLLQTKNIPFYWICDNEKKIGKDIYNIILQPTTLLNNLLKPQCIITVANKTEQQTIHNQLISLQMELSSDFFFYC
ncbi:glycosyltransferase family 2 protein [Bizionia sp. KMM 8389]